MNPAGLIVMGIGGLAVWTGLKGFQSGQQTAQQTAQQKIDSSSVGHAKAGYPYPDIPFGTQPQPGKPGKGPTGNPLWAN